jgi:hypothetical protein
MDGMHRVCPFLSMGLDQIVRLLYKQVIVQYISGNAITPASTVVD